MIQPKTVAARNLHLSRRRRKNAASGGRLENCCVQLSIGGRFKYMKVLGRARSRIWKRGGGDRTNVCRDDDSFPAYANWEAGRRRFCYRDIRERDVGRRIAYSIGCPMHICTLSFACAKFNDSSEHENRAHSSAHCQWVWAAQASTNPLPPR